MQLASNNLPPELIDGIIYLLTAAVGWFARWLKDRQKVNDLKTENRSMWDKVQDKTYTNAELEKERATLVNEVRLMNDRFNELGEYAKNQSATIIKLRKDANEKL